MIKTTVDMDTREEQIIQVESGNIYSVKRKEFLDVNGNPIFEIFTNDLEFRTLKSFNKIRNRNGFRVMWLTIDALNRLDAELIAAQ